MRSVVELHALTGGWFGWIFMAQIHNRTSALNKQRVKKKSIYR